MLQQVDDDLEEAEHHARQLAPVVVHEEAQHRPEHGGAEEATEEQRRGIHAVARVQRVHVGTLRERALAAVGGRLNGEAAGVPPHLQPVREHHDEVNGEVPRLECAEACRDRGAASLLLLGLAAGGARGLSLRAQRHLQAERGEGEGARADEVLHGPGRPVRHHSLYGLHGLEVRRHRRTLVAAGAHAHARAGARAPSGA
mmetsp:Transcript_39290/g.123007  ORF Transcript_39290/g.123007 Transcript_39290/m.123007 type:complete len:200 (-) Transcript_39290:59-658(-)